MNNPTAATAPIVAKAYTASCVPGPKHRLDPDFVAAVQDLEKWLGLPAVLLIQDGHANAMLDERIKEAFYEMRDGELRRGQKVALVIDSNGGSAQAAFEIASLLQRYCGGFTAIIPRHAKSAATLLTLGAEKIIMAEFAELGPLDMQMDVPDREERMSVLDEAQALERLNAFALASMDEIMVLLLNRTGMKVATILPHVRELVTSMLRPLFESVDVVRFTQMSRLLKVAEEYARRLLLPRFAPKEADEIARHLAERYPEHGFIIYRDEAAGFGLNPTMPSSEQEGILSRMIRGMSGLTAIGTMVEVSS